ncbi:MAG: hypothetical protein AB7V16_13745 [Vulcanibacillus sp.]
MSNNKSISIFVCINEYFDFDKDIKDGKEMWEITIELILKI